MTSDFGCCIPSFCRVMVPGESFSVSSNSGVRLAAMNVPTQGKISLRQYHYFVPFNSVYFVFDNLLAKSPVTQPDGTSYTPVAIPTIDIARLTRHICNQYGFYEVVGVQKDGSPYHIDLFYAMNNYTDFTKRVNNALFFTDTTPYNTDLYKSISRQFDSHNHALPFVKVDHPDENADLYDAGAGAAPIPVSLTYDINSFLLSGSDYSSYLGSWSVGDEEVDMYLCCRLNKYGQLVRSIIHGLGYQMNLISGQQQVNALKILAYYKAWFTTFQNTLNISWEDTTAYKFIQASSYSGSHTRITQTETMAQSFYGLLNDLGMCYYRLPADYFSGSTMFNVNDGTVDTKNVDQDEDSGFVHPSYNHNNPSIYVNDGTLGGLRLKLLMSALKYTNKHSVVGRNISDYLRSQYGITSLHNDIHEDVIKLGASRQYIEISDVLSTTENENVKLGEYAGRGIARFEDNTKKFTFDNNSNTFGVWLTISCIVAESGYYQGTLRENELTNRFDWFTPDFDAIGTEFVRNTELFSDFHIKPRNEVDAIAFCNGSFGQMPRYSHFKVGRDIVNGGFTLNSQKATFDPYQIERQFKCYKDNGEYGETYFDGLTNTDLFRTMGYDEKYGNYHRIFNYQPTNPFNYCDRFIIHTFFEVDSYAPMKSLTDSFDTYENNDKAIMADKQ